MSQITRGGPSLLPYTTNTTERSIVVVEFRPLSPSQPIKVVEEVPNDETAKVISDALAGKNVVRCENADDMFRKLGI